MINSLLDLVLGLILPTSPFLGFSVSPSRNVNTSRLHASSFYQIKKSRQYRMWELKIHVILYLIQIYFLTKYLVENAENSISETLDYKIFWESMPPDPSRDSRVRRTLLWTSPWKLYLSSLPPTSNYAPPSLNRRSRKQLFRIHCLINMFWNKLQTVLRRNFFPWKASKNSSWCEARKPQEENKYKCFLRVSEFLGEVG